MVFVSSTSHYRVSFISNDNLNAHQFVSYGSLMGILPRDAGESKARNFLTDVKWPNQQDQQLAK